MTAMKYRMIPENEFSPPPPEPPSPKWRFRWAVFAGIPAAIAAVLFLLNGIDPSFQIEDLLNKLGVVNQNRYVRMMCLMVTCIAILLIVRLFRKKED